LALAKRFDQVGTPCCGELRREADDPHTGNLWFNPWLDPSAFDTTIDEVTLAVLLKCDADDVLDKVASDIEVNTMVDFLSSDDGSDRGPPDVERAPRPEAPELDGAGRFP
jgi:hypothetical protein